MTKQTWFMELRRILSILPYAESKKAEEYYKELYEDKKDAGLSDSEILESFGTPYQAASTVIEEYTRENPSFVPPSYNPNTGYAENKVAPTKGQSDNKENNDLLWIVLCVVFFFPVMGLYIAMIAVAFGLYALIVALFACAIGLPVAFIGAMPTPAHICAWIGVALMLIGIAIPLTVGVNFVVKWMFKGTGMLIKTIKRTVTEG
ncbi:MAG: DUF1700 domain-containing protein [Clostridia bacterium]|nr:DUF1700 domain-containing protein [Clostridia bacterium]